MSCILTRPAEATVAESQRLDKSRLKLVPLLKMMNERMINMLILKLILLSKFGPDYSRALFTAVLKLFIIHAWKNGLIQKCSN
jgi:hypothetical protein